jgi:HlyD family secretion protein
MRTAKVERRDFVRSVRVAGTVEAVEAHPVAAPRISGQTATTLIITKLVPSGTPVHKGDLLVEFDPQAQIRNAQDKEADYNDFVQQINKLRADQASAKASDDTDITQAEDAVSTAELEVKRDEVASRIQAEKDRETLDEDRAKTKQLHETYALKRSAEVAAVRVLEIQRDQASAAMKYARENSEKMTIHSPTDGLAVLNSIWKGSQMGDVQEGDEVRPGVSFMQVVNPSAMRVRSRVNQQDIAALKVGQPVQIRLDAYPDLVFPGQVEEMPAIGEASSMSAKVHTFTVLFQIEGSNPKLLPDLSAAVDVELDRVRGALVLPRDALVRQDGKTYVRLLDGGSTEMRAVKVGAMNEVEAVVESGVQAGQTVLRGVAPEAADSARGSVTTAARNKN